MPRRCTPGPPHRMLLGSMVRRTVLVSVVLFSSLLHAELVLAADDPCAELAGQVASADQQLDRSKADASAWLRQAGQSALVVGPELVVAAQQDSIPTLPPELAQTYGALAAQVGTEMDLFAGSADGVGSADFLTELSSHLLDWHARLAALAQVAMYSASLQAFNAAVQTLDQVSAVSQGDVAIRANLAKALADCQQQHPAAPGPGVALGCGLTYYGLDRSGGQPRLRSAIAALPQNAQPGDQWDNRLVADVQTTSGGAPAVANVVTVDTYRCVADGATKVGRSAVQSNPDGSTDVWGERNYQGTLWPKVIAPGATWQWQAVQYTSDPEGVQADYEEFWTVTVQDVGREMLVLPDGRFEAIHLQYEEDVLQPDGNTPHFSWDEWYARTP